MEVQNNVWEIWSLCQQSRSPHLVQDPKRSELDLICVSFKKTNLIHEGVASDLTGGLDASEHCLWAANPPTCRSPILIQTRLLWIKNCSHLMDVWWPPIMYWWVWWVSVSVPMSQTHTILCTSWQIQQRGQKPHGPQRLNYPCYS